MKKLLLIIIIAIPIWGYSQKLVYEVPTYKNVIKTDKGYMLTGIIIDGDTFPHIKLYPIKIFPKRQFKNRSEQRKYDRLTYNVKRVYPYAILIGNYYKEILRDVQSIPDKSDQKKYLRMKEDQLRKQYEDELINLTFTQGRLLIKLVDRETSHTTFDVIAEFKGNMNAYFWQSLAKMFGTNLKSEYDPDTEDKMIEEIIAQIENGVI